MYVHLVCHGIYNLWCSFCFWCDILTTLLMDFLNLKFWQIMTDQILIAQNQGLKTKSPLKIMPPWTEILERRKISIYPLTPFHKNISGNLGERVDRFSLIHIFWHFEKCSSDHFKKCVMKFQKSKIWDVHFFSFSMLIIVAYAFFTLSKCIWW